MTREEHIQYWVDSSEHDFQAMETLFAHGHTVWSLFIAHLVIEKLLKAYHAKQMTSDCPRIHNLLKLAESTSLALSAG